MESIVKSSILIFIIIRYTANYKIWKYHEYDKGEKNNVSGYINFLSYKKIINQKYYNSNYIKTSCNQVKILFCFSHIFNYLAIL
jgi:hypothetical protein